MSFWPPESEERMLLAMSHYRALKLSLLAWLLAFGNGNAFGASLTNAVDWWSLQPVRRPEIPTTRGSKDWGRNPIDTFISARLNREKLSPSVEADRRVLLRRLYFYLIGLPP